MVVYDVPKMVLNSNEAAPTKFISLGKGEYRVDIIYASGASGTVTPKQTRDPNNSAASSSIEVSGEPVVATGSTGFIIAGPCFIGCVVATISGSVTITAEELGE